MPRLANNIHHSVGKCGEIMTKILEAKLTKGFRSPLLAVIADNP
jgi:hypothetical protein